MLAGSSTAYGASCSLLCLQEREGDRHPAANRALWDSVIDGSKADCVYPEILKFDQKIIMHMGEQPYHPANRRITLRVKLEDLQMKYGLSDFAVMHIVTVRAFCSLLIRAPHLPPVAVVIFRQIFAT